jgi:hypothetical protein
MHCWRSPGGCCSTKRALASIGALARRDSWPGRICEPHDDLRAAGRDAGRGRFVGAEPAAPCGARTVGKEQRREEYAGEAADEEQARLTFLGRAHRA